MDQPARRSPPFYPDAVTLAEPVPATWVLDRVDMSDGCSVKDSFAALDLSAPGFRVLFDAEWVHRPAIDGTNHGLRWTRVRDPKELDAWAEAHGAGDMFRPARSTTRPW